MSLARKMRFNCSWLTVFVVAAAILSVSSVRSISVKLQMKSSGNPSYIPPTVFSAEASYLNFIEDNFGIVNYTLANYSASSVLLDQSFPYIKRPTEENAVVKCFTDRKKMRAKGRSSNDKSKNALVAVSGSPGIGKSAFLTNFPNSEAFKQYCISTSALPPIVTAFTFNSAMHSTLEGNPTIGLRILHGVAWCMHNTTTPDDSWESFLEYFNEFADLKAIDAIRVLRKVYGDRQVLILVDEISKAPDWNNKSGDKFVLSELSPILDNDGKTDILFTSLSTQYIEDLVTGSERPVSFIILPTLHDSHLGREECKKWADDVIQYLNITDDVTINLLRSVYLLASGHPRSIEFMVNFRFDNRIFDACWSNTLSILRSPKSNIINLVLALNSDVVKTMTKDSWRMRITSNEALYIISTTDPESIGDLLEFRSLLQEGLLLAVPSETMYLASIRLSQLIQLLRLLRKYDQPGIIQIDNTDVRGILARIGIKMVLSTTISGIASWFEAGVISNLVFRSRDYNDVESIFKISQFAGYRITSMTLRFSENMTDLSMRSPIQNEIVVPPRGQLGYDARITFTTKSEVAFFMYAQMKIGPSKNKKKTPMQIKAKSVLHTLSNHIESMNIGSYDNQKEMKEIIATMANVNVIFYEWSTILSEKDFNKDLCSHIFDIISESPNSKHYQIINEFIRIFGSTNIHYFGKEKLDTWLIPSFRMIPRLVESIGEEYDKI